MVIAAVLIFLSLFLNVARGCEKTTPDIIPLNEPAYSEHKKGIVQFKHKVHYDERVRSNDCGVCHHDEKGKPIANLEEGDSVQRCIECHTKIGKPPKGTKLEDKIQWHKEAMHKQCKGCHKAFNRNNKDKTARTTCTKCQLKKEKKKIKRSIETSRKK